MGGSGAGCRGILHVSRRVLGATNATGGLAEAKPQGMRFMFRVTFLWIDFTNSVREKLRPANADESVKLSWKWCEARDDRVGRLETLRLPGA